MKNILLILLFSTLSVSVDAQASINFEDTTYNRYITVDTHYHHNNWQIGKPHKPVFSAAYSGLNAIVTDTFLPYQAHDTSVFTLKVVKYSGVIGFMPIVYGLQFWYQLDIDSSAKATIEFSGDAGATWKNLFKDSTDFLDWSMGGVGKPNFDTSTHGWALLRVACFHFVDGSSPDSAFFRFTFVTGNNDSARSGWIIDDMEIEYYIEGIVNTAKNNPQISIFPNPATSFVNIASSNKINQVSISNLIGQTVYSHEFNKAEVQADVADLPPGIYLIRINGTQVRKFVKQ